MKNLFVNYEYNLDLLLKSYSQSTKASDHDSPSKSKKMTKNEQKELDIEREIKNERMLKRNNELKAREAKERNDQTRNGSNLREPDRDDFKMPKIDNKLANVSLDVNAQLKPDFKNKLNGLS